MTAGARWPARACNRISHCHTHDLSPYDHWHDGAQQSRGRDRDGGSIAGGTPPEKAATERPYESASTILVRRRQIPQMVAKYDRDIRRRRHGLSRRMPREPRQIIRMQPQANGRASQLTGGYPECLGIRITDVAHRETEEPLQQY